MNRFYFAAMAALAGMLAFSAPSAAERIRLVNINGYSVIDNQHMVLNGGPSDHYLVTLRNPCHGLRSGVEVGLSFPSTTTLYTPFLEYVYTRDDGRCFIETIEPVDSKEAAEALVEERAAEDDGDEAASPDTQD
ncbi:DUF6491 family protein [Maricaulis sp.]|uniref:DUF6491 family protein n=1 Tax=Maricaulis sp. TaxID=1486257 RepID=UPI003A93BCBE